jgi:hypothetical protein
MGFSEAFECPVCYGHGGLFVETECKHRVCLKCGLRYKFICRKSGCPICLREGDGEMVFTISKGGLWAGCVEYSREEERQAIEEILARRCGICSSSFAELSDLLSHYKTHNKMACALCVEHRYDLPSEYEVYSEYEMLKHKRGTAKEPGHPLCLFCSSRFYSKDELRKHCRTKHELCFICERLGKKNEYYRNYSELEEHFKKAHYVCEERECVQSKCNVFADEVELVAHRMGSHALRKEKPLKVKILPRKEPSGAEPAWTRKPLANKSPAMPAYLERGGIEEARKRKSISETFIKRNFPLHAARLKEATDRYESSKISLGEYARILKEIVGANETAGLLDRIKTYLVEEKEAEIDRDIRKVRREIEFPPFQEQKKERKPGEKEEKGGKAEEGRENKKIGYKVFVLKK